MGQASRKRIEFSMLGCITHAARRVGRSRTVKRTYSNHGDFASFRSPWIGTRPPSGAASRLRGRLLAYPVVARFTFGVARALQRRGAAQRVMGGMRQMNVYDRLEELGLELPDAPNPVASYVPFVRTGNLVFISGQVPIADGKPVATGTVPVQVAPEKAIAAARLCGLNMLAVLQNATEGDLNRVKRVVRLGVFVACAPEYADQPKIANGVSDLMVNVFGEERGRHARAAVGSVALPLGVPVEVEGLFEIE